MGRKVLAAQEAPIDFNRAKDIKDEQARNGTVLTRQKVDNIVGKPPSYYDKDQKDIYYGTAATFGNLKATARKHLEIYVDAMVMYTEAKEIYDKIRKSKSRTVVEFAKISSTLVASRKHVSECLSKIQVACRQFNG